MGEPGGEQSDGSAIEPWIGVLGSVRAERGGSDIDLGGPRPRLLLALLVAAGAPVAFDRLIDDLYGGEPPPTARKSAQVHVSNLRRALGDGVILTTPNGYRFDEGSASVDATEFEREVRSAGDLTGTDPARASEVLARALARWHGTAYADFDDHPALRAEVARLGELRLRAVEMRIDADLRLGRHADVLAELETLTTDHPYREELRALQMVALYRSGRQADALRVFGRARELLLDELGIDPSERLREVEGQILAQSPELELADAPGSDRRAVLATEIEDAAALWERDPEAMGRAVLQLDEMVERVVAARRGTVVRRSGDGALTVFGAIGDAIDAAVELQTQLRAAAWPPGAPVRVRAAVDEGRCEERDGTYVGPVVHRATWLATAGHGGQVVAPESALTWVDVASRPLGPHELRGVGTIAIHQITAGGLDEEFPELCTDRAPTAATPTGLARSIRGYELREPLGEGDFGIVHRAYQASVGREVAIKAIRPELANRPDFVKRFEAEAQFVAQLEHPHIVSLYDYWRDPDGAYLVMPLLAGGSVAAALEGGPWNPPAVLRLAEQVGSALAYAHRHGVTHRDIKPGNVLLDTDGNAYLSDFGIATRSIDLGPDATSVVYQAPEQLAGGPADARSDLYCFALLVHELLTGVRTPLGASPRPPQEVRHDLPASLVQVFDRAADADPARRYERIDDFLRELRRAFGADVSTGAVPAATEPVRNPFKGLRAFAEVDARDFHGREGLVEELVGSLRQFGFVAAVGPSGSGKSSVVKAGVLPAVRAGALGHDRDVVIAEMFPGTYPFEELEAALLRVAVDRPDGLVGDLGDDDRGLLRVSKRILPDDDTGLLLVIDQFEELFSLVTDEETRARFLANLVTVARDERSRVTVLATMRADFFDRPLRYPEFAAILERGLVPVAMPSEENLALAIAQPARSVGLDLEPGLVTAIVSDVSSEPGALPLLQYAMTELVERAGSRTLTNAAYAEIGGASGALARRAEEIYEGLSPSRRIAARDLFLRLVTVSDEADDTRRRVRRSELATMASDQSALDAAIDEYGAFRLLSFDHDPVTRGPTVEVAHEALIREWPRYREWIDERRDDLLLGRRLETAAREWDEGERDRSFLLRGGRLEQYREWTRTTDLRITDLEREYLAESERLGEELEREEAEHERRDESLRRRSRLLLASAAAAVVMLLLAGLALVSRDRAQSARDEAQQLADEIELNRAAQQFASDAVTAIEDDPRLAVSLSLAAVRATETTGFVEHRALDALHWSLQSAGVTFPADDTTPVGTRPSPDGVGVQGVFGLPVDALVDLAREEAARQLSDIECSRYFGDGDCPQPDEPVRPGLEPIGGMEAYFAATDPDRPLAGTEVRIGHQVPHDIGRRWAFAIDTFVDDEGIGVEWDFVDLTDATLPDRSATDLVLVESHAWIEWAADADKIVDLAPFLPPAEMERRFGAAATGVIGDGSSAPPGVYAVPVSLTSGSHVFYRVDEFEDAGLDVPTTFDELLDVSRDIAELDGRHPWCWTGEWGVRPYAPNRVLDPDHRGSGGFQVTDWLELMLLREGGPSAHAAWANGDVAFSGSEVRSAFERLGTLVFPDGWAYLGASRTTGWNYDTSLQDLSFPEPNCWMVLTASSGLDQYISWGSGATSESEATDWIVDPIGVFPFPAITPGYEREVLIGGSQVALTVDSPEARAVLSTVQSPAFIETYMDIVPGYIPADVTFERSATAEPGTVEHLRTPIMEDLRAALRDGRAHRGASDFMPFEFMMDEYLAEQPNWFWFQDETERERELTASLERLDRARRGTYR